MQLANLVVGVLIYAPFVLIANKIKVKQINDAFRSLLRRSCATADSSRRCLDHNDDAGSLARSLITDLEYDYRHGEGLFLEFQPQICSRTGRVVGVESLIRWKHPSYGLIPAPITVALGRGFRAHPTHRAVGLETACQVRKSWLDAGITDLWMAVNVSALQLERSFPKQLLDIAARYDLPPSLLEVEVTESSALDSDKPESHILSRVYDAGFPVAIDDFGMGHSSLKYLKQFPVSVVKIDGAISREVGTNSICSDIVASITRLCRARNMLSVAEFVENEEQAALSANSAATCSKVTCTASRSCLQIASSSSKRRTAGTVRKVGLKQRVSRGDILRANPTREGQPGSPPRNPLWAGGAISQVFLEVFVSAD